jgi:glycosyltransferase involved in cell wall biosynthesis
MSNFAFSLTGGLTVGGVTSWSVMLAEALIRRGHAASLLVHPNVGWHPEFPADAARGVPMIQVGGPRLTRFKPWPWTLRRLGRVYARSLPCTFVPNGTAMAYEVVDRLRRTFPDQVRVVGMLHGHADSYYRDLVTYEGSIDVFLTPDGLSADRLADRIPHRRAAIHTRPLPVEVPPALPPAREPDGILRLCYAGRITNHEKQVQRLKPLVAALVEQKIPFQLRIIGDGGYRPGLADEMAAMPGVQPYVRFEGMQTGAYVRQALMQSDVVLLVSDTESTGLSLLEGMAVGCIPLSTRCGGPETFIEHAVNGFLVDCERIVDAVPWLERLRSDDAYRQALRSAAYAAVAKARDIEGYVDWFVRVSDTQLG